jgi:5-formyltetrahydrofolate cyclo-ligase
MTKQGLRKHYRQIRENIPQESAVAWSRQMAESLSRRLHSISFEGVLFLFAGVKGEPDFLPYLSRGPYNIALPVAGKNGAMDFFLWFPGDELLNGPFGLLEPNPEGFKVYPRQGDCAIIPALALDTTGNRLGGGMGYYDRWLAEYKSQFIFAEAAVFPPCISTTLLPREPHDIPVAYNPELLNV